MRNIVRVPASASASVEQFTTEDEAVERCTDLGDYGAPWFDDILGVWSIMLPNGSLLESGESTQVRTGPGR